MALRKYECPNCHYRFKADVEQMLEDGKVSVVRLVKSATEPQQNSSTVDLTCPNCDKEFEVKVES